MRLGVAMFYNQNIPLVFLSGWRLSLVKDTAVIMRKLLLIIIFHYQICKRLFFPANNLASPHSYVFNRGYDIDCQSKSLEYNLFISNLMFYAQEFC